MQGLIATVVWSRLISILINRISLKKYVSIIIPSEHTAI